MTARLIRLLAAAVADPDRPIGSLDILSPDERRTILYDWNATARAVPSATLPELFAAQVKTTPAATAVVFEDTSLTYDELDAHSSQLAHHLRALGVGPEVVVGLCVERSLEMLVGLLGILKAGGAYLPLDPDYPPERLAFMLADAGAPVLVTQSALRDRLPLHNARDRAARCRLARHRNAARQRTGSLPAPTTPRLCHLHLRLNRNPEGRRRHACRHSESGRSCRSSASTSVRAARVLQFASLSFRCRALGDLRRRLLQRAQPFITDRRGQAQRRCVGQAHPRARQSRMRHCHRCCWRICRRTCRCRP